MSNKIFVVYCIDDNAVRLLENLREPLLHIVSPGDFETDELLSIKNSRPINAYCWMSKPVVLEDALGRFPDTDWVIFVDSDMMVFGDPDNALPSDPEANVILTPHRPSNDHFAEFIPTVGKYNAGYAGFKRSKGGKEALRWWKDSCIEDCSGTPQDGRYADQKYLEDISNIFSGVFSSPHVGLNTGPWNVFGTKVSSRDDAVFINDSRLLLYHMQGFRVYTRSLVDLYPGPIRLPEDARHLIYQPYEKLIKQTREALEGANPGFKQNNDAPILRLRTLLRELKKFVLSISNISYRP